MTQTRLAALLILTTCLFLALSCAAAPERRVSLLKYQPALGGGLADYQGARLYLMNFSNEDNSTTFWYFFSADQTIAYQGDSFIHNYFWFAFRDALVDLGVWVTDADAPDPYAPALWLTLVNVNADSYTVRLNLLEKAGGAPLLVKLYTVAADPLPGPATDQALESRAYAATNKLFREILTDPEFRTAFFMAQKQGPNA